MTLFRAHIAIVLLILFCRIFVPEAVFLAMHQHEHTEEILEEAYKLSTKHQHCHVDSLYNSDDFSPSEFFFTLLAAPVGSLYMQPFSFVWKFTFPNNTYLRGPPMA